MHSGYTDIDGFALSVGYALRSVFYQSPTKSGLQLNYEK